MIPIRVGVIKEVFPYATEPELQEMSRILELLPEDEQRHLIENLFSIQADRNSRYFLKET